MRRVMAAHPLWVHLPGPGNIGRARAQFNLATEFSRRGSARTGLAQWKLGPDCSEPVPEVLPHAFTTLGAAGDPEMPTTTTKREMLDNLRAMLRDVFQLRTDGVAYAKLARAHGYVDGYMRVMLEAKIATKKELLVLVSEERSRSLGGGTRAVGDAAAAVA